MRKMVLRPMKHLFSKVPDPSLSAKHPKAGKTRTSTEKYHIHYPQNRFEDQRIVKHMFPKPQDPSPPVKPFKK